ncbi:MAG: serine hydrolase [Bacilli bacterium]|nr:serine hydrolase [Bacilli bacterium]MDD3348596.1 serine hydrolase [Bacilli bacterium]MDY0209235.1 serine hydrolase [Bacilli bacterium]
MSTLHMMIGIQGSGKTTYTKKLSEEFGAKIVSSDLVRTLHPDWSEEKIFPEVYRLCAEYLQSGMDVVADSTSITPRVRKRYVDAVKVYGVDFDLVAHYFTIPYEVCCQRVRQRNLNPQERYLPLPVIVSYLSRMVPPTLAEGFKEIKTIDQIEDVLLNDLVINQNQGYAFYFKIGNSIIERYQGRKITTHTDYIDKYTNFRLASVSKQFIARAVVQLVADGLLQYETTLKTLYPDLPDCYEKIKIIHMLNHTSGIKDYEDMPHTEAQIVDADVFAYVNTQTELYFEVGTMYRYSNTAYVLLGLVIEKVSHMKLDQYITKKIFTLANMMNSFVNYEGITEVTNRAYGHKIVAEDLLLNDQYWCSATIGDGGLYASVNDLINWLHFLQRDALSKQMFVPNILPDGKNSEYGLGIRIIHRQDRQIIYHCGETIGTNTVVGFIPSLDVEFIFLTNLSGVPGSKFIQNLLHYLSIKA